MWGGGFPREQASHVSSYDAGSTALGGQQLENSPESTTEGPRAWQAPWVTCHLSHGEMVNAGGHGVRSQGGPSAGGAWNHRARVSARAGGRDPSLWTQNALTPWVETRSPSNFPAKEFAFWGTVWLASVPTQPSLISGSARPPVRTGPDRHRTKQPFGLKRK